mgnify:CR=1 FL=1
MRQGTLDSGMDDEGLDDDEVRALADGTRRGLGPGGALERSRMFASLYDRMFGDADPVYVGRFRLRSRLGAGASGIVYEAHDPELDRDVALKILSGSDEDRLASEARALARLRHANVVTVHEVGSYEGGRFIAMDLVRGETLGHWAARGHGWRAIVDVFAQAGRGLAAAHEAGLIHRDVKPDNVLIEDGQARVVDFGLAHEVEAEPGCIVAGTPAYMSPEAFAGRLSPASDQFSLCATMYEAAFGVRPFGGDDPQTYLALVGTQQLARPQSGSRHPRWLRRVIVRGLAEDPDARWPSVAALVAQLEQRRRRRGGMVTVLGLAGALGAGGVAVWGYGAASVDECAAARTAIERSWNPARQQRVAEAFRATGASSAEDAVVEVSRALDEYAGAWSAMRVELCQTARELGDSTREGLDPRLACLDRRRRELDALLTAFEAADTELVRRAPDAVDQLRSIAECDEEAQRAIADVGVPESVELRLAAANAARLTGRYAQALDDARALARQADEAGWISMGAEAHMAVASLENGLGDYAAAERSAKAALDRAERRGDDNARLAAQLKLIAALAQQHDSVRAHEWIELTKATLGRVDAGWHAHAELAHVTANVFQAEGRYEESVAAGQEALALRERHLPPDALAIATSHYGLGTVLGELARPTEAVEHMARVLEIRTKKLGPRHPSVAKAHDGLAQQLNGLGRHEEAGAHFRQAIDIGTDALGADNIFVAKATVGLAITIAATGKLREAEVQFRRSTQLLVAALGPDAHEVAIAHLNLARVLVYDDRPREGIDELLEAKRIYESQLRPDHPSYIYLANNLTTAYRKLGDLDASLASAEHAHALALDAFGPDHDLVALTDLELGETYVARNEPDKALAAVEAAVRTYERIDRAPNQLAVAYEALAEVHEAAGRHAEAELARAKAAALMTD